MMEQDQVAINLTGRDEWTNCSDTETEKEPAKKRPKLTLERPKPGQLAADGSIYLTAA